VPEPITHPTPGGYTLIGLPGCGKSTIGVQLAKSLVVPFVDTDITLQADLGISLQCYLDKHGIKALRDAETRCVIGLDIAHKVIATGGSVVHSRQAMAHLCESSPIVYIEVTFATMIARLGDYSDRGIAADLSLGLRAMYDERVRLYAKYADRTVNGDRSAPEVLAEICSWG